MKIRTLLEIAGVILILLYGCSKKSNPNFDDLEIIHFDSSKSKGSWCYDFKYMLDSTISIIPLETTEECLIANIEKIEIRNGHIFIQDDLAKSVFMFDMEGRYQGKINSVGQGPGEYVTISYLTVTDSTVIVIDHNFEKQLEYKIPDLQFLREEKIFEKIWITQLFTLPGVVYYINDWSNSRSGKYRLFTRNYGSKSFSKFLPFNEEPVCLGIGGMEYAVNGDSALVIYSGDDIIYRIKDNVVYPQFKMEYKDQRVKYPQGTTRTVFEDNPEGRVIGPASINESDRYIFIDISLTGNNGDYTCIYDKITKETTIYQCSFIVSYFDSFDNWELNRVIENKIISFFSADMFIENIEADPQRKYPNSEYEKLVKSVRANLKEDDNPVLFIFSLKK